MKRRREGRLRRASRLGLGVLGLGFGIMLLPVAPPVRAQDPAPAPVTVAEQVFFQRLHDLVEARKWPEAQRHIQQLQALRTEPAWLAPRDGELRLAQFKISRGQGDLTGMLNAARLFLNGDEARSQQMFEIVRQMDGAGERAAAIAVLKEVVSRTPKFASAQRLLAEWDPPVAKPPRPVRKTEPPAAKPEPKKAPAAPPPMPERKTEPVSPEQEAAAHLAALRSRHAADDLPGMLSAARLFLNGDRERAQKLLEVAREFRTRGDSNAAILLTKEVLRRTPGFPPAERLLSELEAAPAPPP